MKTLTRKISIIVMAIFAIMCMATSVVLAVRTVNATTSTQASLTLNGAINKKDNVYYNVAFDYQKTGNAGYYSYWGSANGTTDAKTTIEFDAVKSVRTSSGGETMGIARGTSTSSIAGYGFAYNGGNHVKEVQYEI